MPIDEKQPPPSTIRNEPSKPAAVKSRLKRLFERQFPKLVAAGDAKEKEKMDECELEPISVCLDRLVLSFIEDTNDRSSSSKCCRRRCNCFNGNCDDSSDDELATGYGSDASELLKGLIPCESLTGRNLLADASKIVETNKIKIGKSKDNCIRILTENLRSLCYDASICRSKWEKSPSISAGAYEYIDVIIESDRFIVDVDFRSEFEIARSTKSYRAILQSLPSIVVGKPDRIERIVALVSEAARQSLKKKGLHFPPWRKLEYMKAKWLAPYVRADVVRGEGTVESSVSSSSAPCAISAVNFDGKFEMRGESEKITVVVSQWTPPAVRPKSVTAGTKVVTGLSLDLTEKITAPVKF